MTTQSDNLVNEYETWRIQGVIDFTPDLYLLRNVQNGQKITLFSPAARCLMALILRQGCVISQKELMYIGWESEGLTVSPNAYYQNIANIRKSLADIKSSDTYDIITTIKRSGLIIPNEVVIEKVDGMFLYDPLTPLPDELTVTSNTNINIAMLCTIVIMLISIIAMAFIKHYFSTPFSPLLNNYFLLKTLPSGCKVYVNNENSASGNLDTINKLIPSCKKTNVLLLPVGLFKTDILSCCVLTIPGTS